MFCGFWCEVVIIYSKDWEIFNVLKPGFSLVERLKTPTSPEG